MGRLLHGRGVSLADIRRRFDDIQAVLHVVQHDPPNHALAQHPQILLGDDLELHAREL